MYKSRNTKNYVLDFFTKHKINFFFFLVFNFCEAIAQVPPLIFDSILLSLFI